MSTWHDPQAPGPGPVTVAPPRGSAMTGRLVLGLVMILLGALWTLDNFDLIESEPITRWWPVLLLAAGLCKLTGTWCARQLGWGLVLSVIGAWVLLDTLNVADVDLEDVFPMVLVAIGILLLTRATRRRSIAVDVRDRSEVVDAFAMWSGNVKKVASQSFRGGDLTAIMGGVEVDLRSAASAPGGAVVEVFALWGGIDFFVPPSWRVVSEATVLMGAIEDKSSPSPDATSTLVIRGFVLMGGVEIKP